MDFLYVGLIVGFVAVSCAIDLLLRTSAEAAMSWMYIVSGVLAVAILVYLVVALLYPEKF